MTTNATRKSCTGWGASRPSALAGIRTALLCAAVAGAVALARPAFAQDAAPVWPWLPEPTVQTPTDSAPATPANDAAETAVDENKVGEPAFVVLSLPDSVSVGKPLLGQVEVKNAEGRPLDNKVLLIYLNGEVARRMRTDAEGRADLRIGADDLPVGDYTLEVVAEATQAYREATAEAAFNVRPAVVEMITVPPSPGVEFRFDGQTFVADEEGIARLIANQPGIYDVEIVIPEELAATKERAGLNFVRWDDDQFNAKRTIEVYGDMDKHVGLARSYMISLAFLDRNGVEVDPARIEEVVIKSSTGTRYTLEPTAGYVFTSNRVARLNAGLVPTEVQYGLESVIVDGANVVNQNQQRFVITENATWPVDLLLFDAVVRAADAFFGFPVGTGISLTYPSEREEFIAFNENNEAVVHNLARGVYKIQVQGVSGMAPLTPMVISRNQDATLKVLSTLDMAALGTAGALGALGLLLVGRPHLTRLGLRPRRAKAGRPQPENAPLASDAVSGANAAPARTNQADALEQPAQARDAAPPPVQAGRAQRTPLNTKGRGGGAPATGYRHFKADPTAPRPADGKQTPRDRSKRS